MTQDAIRWGIDAARAGAWDEALAHFEGTLRRMVDDENGERASEVLRRIGEVHFRRGRLELAAEAFDVSLAVAEAQNRPADVAAAVNCCAVVAQYRSGVDEAQHLYLRARSLAEGVGDRRLLAMIEQNLGTIANIRGDLPGALASYRSALGLFRSLGQPLPAAWVLNNMGMAHIDLEQWAEAEASLDEAQRLAQEERDAVTLGSIELNRADMHLKRRRFDSAREACDLAFEIFGRAESIPRLAETYKFYGILYRETDKLHLAEEHLARSLELARSCDDRLIQAEGHAELALLHLARDGNREALEQLNRAHELFRDFGARREIVDLERRLDRLELIFLRVVRSWAESIESKDRYTAGHCERVADYACLLAEAVGIEGRDLAWFRMGAFLHDVGKVAVPSEILNKPGRLTDEEFEVMKRHTVVGDEIIADLDFPWDIRPIVRNHHEHWDGGGYPDGLAGEAIPLTARVLCAADVYDALTTERSYRRALPRGKALGIMQRDAGTLLDPDLFATFRELIEERVPPAHVVA